MLVKIDVTREIIDGSNGTDGEDCMVFNAAKQKLPRLEVVGIIQAVFVDDEWNRRYIPIPIEVQDKISDHFCGNIEIEPFSFDWEVPDDLCD